MRNQLKFQCYPSCPKTFASRKHMELHLKYVHKIGGENAKILARIAHQAMTNKSIGYNNPAIGGYKRGAKGLRSNPLSNPPKKYEYKITYSTITPESAEKSDFADMGIEDEGKETLREIVRIAKQSYGIRPRGSCDLTDWWESNYDINYRTGEEKQYTLHIKGVKQGSRLFKAVNAALAL